ncbi:Acetyl esterase/lipase [Amycolatopsis xylanica]|uniref:Acetyl esterase/lipase n=1 Tax=Amycolatopsis xylanica TaxID=589385 RepID=A0A1H2SJ50_9PSEU|nr:alpha/beta hydrolase fold domain-containing protein [Amycolatopsis xylanica]SDW31666.1 Acetyl esterase/lipase [Amycolatopsis xylanica]
MSVIEMTTFTVEPERTRAMLEARRGMLEAFRADRRGFLAARLVRVDERTWLDFVEWTDDAAWDESKAKGANLPAIGAFFATIDGLVGAERGVRYDDPAGGRVRTVAYGTEPSQVGELYLPEGDGPFPVVTVVHGGYWSAMWDRRQITDVVDDLVAVGYAVWNIEYRRIGEPGGGWPGTFLDVAAAVDALEGMDPALDTSRVVLLGHSAGGHLATWAGHRAALPSEAPGAGPKIVPIGVVSLGAPLDLRAADATGFGKVLADPDAEPPKDAPETARPEVWPVVADMVGDGITKILTGGHFDWTSPLELPGAGVPMLAVHGTADEAVPAEWSRRYAEKTEGARYIEVDGGTHFDVVHPHHPVWPAVTAWIGEVIERLDHEAILEQAWNAPGTTTVELPPVRVNEVLRERYDVRPPFAYTGALLWDMESRKAAAPDKYIPSVVKPGSAEKFPSTWHGRFEDFTRVSEQRLWADPGRYATVIEHVRLDHENRRAFFVGAERFEAPDGRVFTAGAGQPIFHVEHSVTGTENDPRNVWRVVHLTIEPDPALAAAFEPLANDRYLRDFIEIHLRDDLGHELVRR